jgi:hypothetical protein
MRDLSGENAECATNEGEAEPAVLAQVPTGCEFETHPANMSVVGESNVVFFQTD